MKMKDDQNFWNFWLLMLSVVLLILELWILAEYATLPTSIGLFDALLITLASFRLTRLFVYDSIMHFVRDWFLVREISFTDTEVVVTRRKHPSGFMRAMSDLFSCPWCCGLQIAMLVVFFYYLTPLSWIVIFMFAVGGVATMFQLIANAIGWRAENLKRLTESTYTDPKTKGSSGGTCG
jgi:hypothetical protein